MLKPPCTPKYALRRQLMTLLKKQGMTYKELSIRADVPIKTLYRWSYGDPPSRVLGPVYRVSKTLGVTIEELIFNTEKEASTLFGGNPLNSLNEELRRALRGGLNERDSSFLPTKLEMLTLTNPVVVPSYMLLETAKELGRVEEI